MINDLFLRKKRSSGILMRSGPVFLQKPTEPFLSFPLLDDSLFGTTGAPAAQNEMKLIRRPFSGRLKRCVQIK